jgi:CelD/BcsL family acetyltransferase involved in cellulose biosynthesis
VRQRFACRGFGLVSMFRVAIENSFDFLSAEYAALFERSAATAFQHPRWLAGLYARLVTSTKAEPLIIVVRHADDGRLAMVLPLVRSHYAVLRIVEFADMRVTDYVSPVTDVPTFARIASHPDCVKRIRQLCRPYDLLRIGKLADQSLRLERLFGIERESMGMNAYATPLAASYQEWRESRLERSYRKELDKKSRQLHRKGSVRFECARDKKSIDAVFEAMRHYRGLRFGDPKDGGDLLQLSTYYEFYRGLALEGRDDLTRTYGLWLDDRVIAGVLGLAHRNSSFLVIMGGFDFENFKNQSIGSLMFQQVARDCIERGERCLDFTIGDEPYKLTFGAKPAPMWKISHAGSPLGYAADFLTDRMPALKALARRLLHKAQEQREPQPTLPQAAEEAPRG